MMPTNTEGDPGKLKYLHDPNWTGKLFSDTRDAKVMPGTCELCVFGRGEHADGCAAFQKAELERFDAEWERLQEVCHK